MIIEKFWATFEKNLPENMDVRLKLISYATFLQAMRDTAHCAHAISDPHLRDVFLATVVKEAQDAIDTLPEAP